MRLRCLMAAVTLAAARTGSAAVDPYVAGFTVPATYGAAGSTYQEWVGFTSPAGPNVPTYSANATGTANWVDRSAATDGAFLIGSPGSGRVYSPTGPLTPEVSLTAPAGPAGSTVTLVLQVEAAGNGLDASAFSVTPAGGGAAASPASVEVASVLLPGGGFGGSTFDYLVTWTGLTGTAFTVDYATAGSSSSQRAARVDTAIAVPEPTSAALVAAAAFGLLGRRRQVRR